MRAFKLLTVTYLLFTAFGVVLWTVSKRTSPPLEYVEPLHEPVNSGALTPQTWFNGVRPLCNPTEVDGALTLSPVPGGDDGASYAAICWALAGRVDHARSLLHGMPEQLRQRTAVRMFGVVHAEADGGREAEMGPAMELVLEFQPTNMMALYHAGSAAYADARPEAARDYLQRFIELYGPEDGWRSNAVSMLETLSQ